MPQLGDKRWLAEWCPEALVDEFGDLDIDRLEWRTKVCKSEAKALDYAEAHDCFGIAKAILEEYQATIPEDPWFKEWVQIAKNVERDGLVYEEEA